MFMDPRLVVKNFVEQLPEVAGRPLARIPFAFRLGAEYIKSGDSIRQWLSSDQERLEGQLLEKLRFVLRVAVERVPFYQQFYREAHFDPNDLRELSDWKHVPVVTKRDFQRFPLEARRARGKAGLRVNTGGTSGQPLEFLLDKHAFAREWAHMHHIWKARGYNPRHLKLTLRGKYLRREEAIRYNPVHNEYVVNANCSMSEVVEALASLPRRSHLRWVHGYPSLVAEFAHCLSDQAPGFAAELRHRLFGVLLGSEYPAPVYCAVIEDVLSNNIVSWYGHSEMAVLARETSAGVYESLPTYGYAEALPSNDGAAHRLVCTSLHNTVHPFIRYDTGDLIEPVTSSPGGLAFRIREGRIGDFVVDRQGRKLGLTAIIFGRHHAAFASLKHLQVRDEGNGRMTLIVTPRDTGVSGIEIAKGFDFAGLDIDWRVEIVDGPVRTQAGKIQLKIN